MHPRAVAILENFGGLKINPPTLEGRIRPRCNSFWFDPVGALVI